MLLDKAIGKFVQFFTYSDGSVSKRIYPIGSDIPEDIETVKNGLPNDGIHNQEFEWYKHQANNLGK